MGTAMALRMLAFFDEKIIPDIFIQEPTHVISGVSYFLCPRCRVSISHGACPAATAFCKARERFVALCR
jgi:hypothetical protein